MRLTGLEQALPDPWQDYREQRARERREAADREQALRRASEEDDEEAFPLASVPAFQPAFGLASIGRRPRRDPPAR